MYSAFTQQQYCYKSIVYRLYNNKTRAMNTVLG